MIPGNKILLYFTPWNKVTLFHGKILKPISDVKFVNIANLSITNFCGIWKFLILSSLKVYFKCLFRRSWGSEIKSNYKFNGNKFALFHSYLVFTRRPPPPAGSWKQVTREIKRYFIAIEYIVTSSLDMLNQIFFIWLALPASNRSSKFCTWISFFLFSAIVVFALFS